MPPIRYVEVVDAGYHVLFTKPSEDQEWVKLVRWLHASKADIWTHNCTNTVHAKYFMEYPHSPNMVEEKIQLMLKETPSLVGISWDTLPLWHTIVRFWQPCALADQQRISQALFGAVGRFPSWDYNDKSLFTMQANEPPSDAYLQTLKEIASS